jgi:hypothetical protein
VKEPQDDGDVTVHLRRSRAVAESFELEGGHSQMKYADRRDSD